jgi:hypothetical protein
MHNAVKRVNCVNQELLKTCSLQLLIVGLFCRDLGGGKYQNFSKI